MFIRPSCLATKVFLIEKTFHSTDSLTLEMICSLVIFIVRDILGKYHITMLPISIGTFKMIQRNQKEEDGCRYQTYVT